MGIPRDADARKFYRVAWQRLDDAKVILSKAERPAAARYLGGYAVECMFKALILRLTPRSERPPSGAPTIEWLKSEFGHDLDALRRGIASRGPSMPKDIAGNFVFVSTWDPQTRYEPGEADPEDVERFLSSAEALLKWIDQKLS